MGLGHNRDHFGSFPTCPFLCGVGSGPYLFPTTYLTGVQRRRESRLPLTWTGPKGRYEGGSPRAPVPPLTPSPFSLNGSGSGGRRTDCRRGEAPDSPVSQTRGDPDSPTPQERCPTQGHTVVPLRRGSRGRGGGRDGSGEEGGPEVRKKILCLDWCKQVAVLRILRRDWNPGPGPGARTSLSGMH